MAQTKLAITFLLLLVVTIFSHFPQPTEGRHVKPGSKTAFKKPVSLHKQIPKMEVDNIESATLGEPTVPGPTAPAASRSPPPPPPGRVDDFRPTAPGHSPGIGHSLHT
nr:hypothetical protein CDL12_03514 [Ipomoea trifida]